MIYNRLGDRASALENFRKAQVVFSGILDSDHEVFRVIESYMKAE